MQQLVKSAVMALLVAALVLGVSVHGVMAQEEPIKTDLSDGAMIVDAFVVRPLGLIGTVVGTVAYVVSLPVSVPGGNSDEAYERLVVEPARFTFKRQLGDI